MPRRRRRPFYSMGFARSAGALDIICAAGEASGSGVWRRLTRGRAQACVAWRRRAGAGREYRGAPGSARCLRAPSSERANSRYRPISDSLPDIVGVFAADQFIDAGVGHRPPSPMRCLMLSVLFVGSSAFMLGAARVPATARCTATMVESWYDQKMAGEEAAANPPAGLTPEQISHPRTGLIMGSGGGSPANQIEAADTLREKGIRRVGPYQVTRCMSSTVSACLATNFKVKGINIGH